ncbi:MAG: phenylalanine--tRNA ligase subunit beta [Sporolactobacillus sp.]
MRFSYKWLQDYVELTDVTPEQLAGKITNAGIEVEHLEYPGAGLSDIVVGRVLTCTPHPQAAKLHVCRVTVGGRELQIVCGAPNVAAGQKVPVALPGAVIGGGRRIETTVLHGETSEGMICALSELGVDQALVPKEYADGIYVFDDEVPIGADALPYLDLDDAILDLDILVSSAHCMSVIGLAHEVAAVLDRPVRIPVPRVEESGDQAADHVHVTVDCSAADQVPYYGARVIEHLVVRASPRWMQLRLMAAGVRPISNVVDIANYVMIEYGQPLHTFDFDAFGSNEVLVRLAKEGEQAVTLDGKPRTLTAEDVLITNGREPVAIAGVMGGESSEVRTTTTRVLLEAAIFDAITVRRTSARLGLRTDASSRYEKRVDRNRVAPAADRAAELLERYAGGSVLGGMVEAGERTVAEAVIDMPLQTINRVLGTGLADQEIVTILRRLGFGVKEHGKSIHVTVPSRRFDVSIPEDLVEEVGRLYGYNRLPATLPEGTADKAGLTPYQQLIRRIETQMESLGLTQAYTYSLTTDDQAAALAVSGAGRSPVRVAWPMSEEHASLRMSLIPQLIDVLRYHANRQLPDVAFYEIGKVFIPQNGTVRPREEEHLAGALTGRSGERNWEGDKPIVDFYTAKGIVESFFEQLGLGARTDYRPAVRAGLHPGQTADVYVDGECVGYVGTLHPQLAKAHALGQTAVFEIAAEPLLRADQPAVVYTGLPRFPSVTRDVALVVKKTVLASTVERVIVEAGGKLLRDVRLFDVYEGDHVGTDEKSLAFSLVYADPARTLTDEEVDAAHQRIVAACAAACGAALRG